MKTLSDFIVVDSSGGDVSLSCYGGDLVLIVNVASHCGFTKQYAGLQTLYDQYKSKGLVVLAFPCNQFGEQEPGSDEVIQNFCSTRYSVTFPVFSKVTVKGPSSDPLFQWLCQQAPGLMGAQSIKWNFTKFLVHRDGQTVKRFAPMVTPEKMESYLLTCL